MSNPNLLTAQEACEALGVSHRTFVRWYRDLLVPVASLGGRKRYLRWSVDALLAGEHNPGEARPTLRDVSRRSG